MFPKYLPKQGKRVFISLLVVCLALSVLVVAGINGPVTTAAAQDMNLLYQENFNDGRAQGWEFSPSDEGQWWVENGLLNASGHAWAKYGKVEWGIGQYLYSLDFILGEEGGVGVNFQQSEAGYYRVEFRRIDKHHLYVTLKKVIWYESVTDMASEQNHTFPYDFSGYYRANISFGDGKITFSPMQTSLAYFVSPITVQDPDPLPPGSISFESYRGSSVRLDNLAVYGPQPTPTFTPSWTFTSSPTLTKSPRPTRTPFPSSTPTQTPTRTPTNAQEPAALPVDHLLPDLKINAVTAGPYDKNEGTQPLSISISNIGEAAAGPSRIRIRERGDGQEGYDYALEGLAAGQEMEKWVKFEIPDRLLGKSVRFEIDIDPDNVIQESNERNNHLVSPPIEFPKPVNYLLIIGSFLGGAAVSVIVARLVLGQLKRRKDLRKMESKPSTSKPALKGDLEPRYANAVLLDQAKDLPINPHKPIEPGKALRLRLDIGEYAPISAVVQPKPLPEHLLPRDIWLDVMVSSSDFEIRKSISETGPSTTANGRFFLPGDGSPARMEDGDLFMYFNMVAPPTPTMAHARIGYYYCNHLVQSQLLTADIGGAEGGYHIDIDFSLTDSLLDIADLPARQQISILTNSNHGGHQIIVRPSNVEGEIVGRACTYGLNVENIGNVVSELRDVLRDRIAPAPKKRRTKRDLEVDLRLLAPLGRKLWRLTVAKCLHDIYPIQLNKEPVVIHVSRPTTADYTFPWSIIYDIPLNENNPSEWKLCPLVEKWDDKYNKLVKLGTRRCPEATGPNGSHESNTLCPFGFWGYQYDIEQLSSCDTPTLTIPIPSKAAFPVAAILTQDKKILVKLYNHIQALEGVLKQTFPKVDLIKGKDLLTIRKIMGQDEPFIYFFCHGERSQYGDPDTYLCVGNNEKFLAGDFQDWVQEWLVRDGRKVWDKIRPLIFINACHSVEIQNKTFASYLDAFISTGHAAGVIGTEVKVQPSIAMDIGLEFSRLFFGGKSVGETMHLLRTDYLSDGNLYGLIYTPYCWSDLTIVRV